VLCSGMFFPFQATFLGAFIYRKMCLVRSTYPSICPHVSARFPLDEFPSNFILGTVTKMFQENSNLVTFGQKYRSLYMKTEIRFFVAINHCCATLNIFPLLALTRISTIHVEGIVAVPVQQWLRERANINVI
jgi:hypothetical protein